MNAKPTLATRFIQVIGTDATISWHWDTNRNDTCKYGHRAHVVVASSEKPKDYDIGGSLSDYYNRPDLKPACCERCSDPMPAEHVSLSMGWSQRYNTPTGRPEPGDLYFLEEHTPEEHCPNGWTNCKGMHLNAVCPNGGHWDIDSRASNCTKPNDTTHRCWVRHGDPSKGEPVHVDKNGETCNAGAGSIIYGDYHGFLRHGSFVSC